MRSKTPRRDVVLVTGLLVIGLLEAAWVSGAERPLALALVVPLTVPLLWRASHPSAVALVVTGAIVVQLPWASVRIFDQTFIGFVGVLLAFYALGRHGRRPRMVPVLLGCGLAFAGALGWYDRSLGSFVLALAFVGAAGVTGAVVAQRAELRELLERQGEALKESAKVTELARVAEVRGRIAGEVQALVSRRVHEMVARSAQARSLMRRDSVGAAELVAEVEADGRAALDEMRTMLGVLRSTDLWGPASPESSPGPVAPAGRLRWLPLRRVEQILLAALVVLLLAESLVTRGSPIIAATLVPPLLAFLVGTRLSGRASVAGLGVALVAVTTVNLLVVRGQWGDYVFPSVLVVLAWLGGRAMRSQNDLVQQARRGAAALESSITERSEAAAAQERLRLARDLHDVLAHTLMLMVVQAGGARRSIQSGRTGAEEALRVVEETGRDATTELRQLLSLVDPHSHPGPGEPGATPGLADLRSLVARAQDAGLTAELAIQGEPVTVPSGVALAAYRIAQEAVTNVIRHAHATQVRLTLHYAPGQLDLEVRDNGHGAPDTAGGSGNGLTGMRERAATYHARLRTGPAPDTGYLVHATFPLTPCLQGSLA